MKTWSSGPGLSIVKRVGLSGGGLSCDMVRGARSTRFHRNGFRVRPSSLEKPDLVLGRFLPTRVSLLEVHDARGLGRGAVSLKRLHTCAELRPRLTAANS